MTAVTPEQTAKLKSAAAEASKGTIRGGGSTVAWGYAVWVVLVEKIEWSLILDRGRADSFTFLVVGVVAAVITGFFRLMEQRRPNSIWSTLLLSQGAPVYNGSQDGAISSVTRGDVTINYGTTTSNPTGSPTVEPAPPLFSPGEPEMTPPPYVPPVAPPAVAPPTALDDPESDDTSLTPISVDPADLLEGH